MPTPQRLPVVNSDDGVWGDIIRQFLMKEHYNDDTDNAVNGGHQKITVRAGTASAGTAPIKLTSGTLMTTPETGAIEFNGDNLYFTQTSSTTRKKVALYDDTSGATGDIYYRNSTGYFTRLGIGSSGDLLTVSSGLPAWSSTLSDKTLTGPKVDILKDTSGNTQFTTSATDMVMSVDIDMEGHYLWNLHAPVDPLDAATKEYVDTSTGSLGRNDGNLVIGGDFQTDSQWVNAWGTQTTAQAIGTGEKSHQIVSTGGGTSTDYLSLTHDGTGTPTTFPGLSPRLFVWRIHLLKKTTNTGGGNLRFRTLCTDWTGTTASAISTIATSGIDSSTWFYWERTHTVSSAYKSIQFLIELDSGVPAGDTFYIGAALISDVTGGVAEVSTQTLTNKTLTAPIISTISNTGTLTLPTSTDTLVGRATIDTLTNKRVNPRINSTASSATPSINIDTTDQFNITALATNITSMTTNLTGTPVDGQKLMIRIKDDGTARTITWGTSFQSSGVATLLSTTVVSKTHHIALIYDSTAAKWICLAVDELGY